MKSNILFLIGAIVVVALFGVLFLLPANTGATDSHTETLSDITPSVQEPELEELDIRVSTDKYVYHSNNAVLIQINVTVPEFMKEAEVEFFGVKNKYGAYKMKRKIEMDLVKGLNIIDTKSNVPSCYGCSGINPGKYQLNAALNYENGSHRITAATEIEILK